MNYERILLAAADEIWAIEQRKLAAIVAFLAAKADGVTFTAEEIAARIGPARERAVAEREGSVAIIPVRGVIANRMNMMGAISGGTSSEGLSHAISAALTDPAVKAIVLDVDSPGGAVMGADELSAQIFAARGRKPIVAQVDGSAASAAYWIASAAEEVVVTPSGQVGSIGVLAAHDDLSTAVEKAGLRKTVVSAGKYKNEGSPFEPLSEEARAYLQARVDAAYAAFVERVAANRGVSAGAVRNGFGEGRMVDAKLALREGMVDRIATMSETLARFGASPARVDAAGRRAFAPQRELRSLDHL